MECGSGQYNILAPPPFSARVVYAITFSIKQWLLQRLVTALAVLRTSQSHLEAEESLCPFHWQPSCKIASSVWMEVSLQEATAAISLQSIQAIKKELEKSIAQALSIPRWKDGKNIPPSKERHDNFQLQAFQCVIL